MKLINNSISPLPFYDDVAQQNHRKDYAFGQVFPLLTYKNMLLPFQFCIKKQYAKPNPPIDKANLFINSLGGLANWTGNASNEVTTKVAGGVTEITQKTLVDGNSACYCVPSLEPNTFVAQQQIANSSALNIIDGTRKWKGWATQVGTNLEAFGKFYAKAFNGADMVPVGGNNYDITQITARLKGDTIYTLSFFAKGNGALTTFCYPNVNAEVLKASSGSTILNSTSSDAAVNHILTSTYKRYFVTFRTKTSATSGNVLFRGNSASCSGWIYAPMLSEGENLPNDWYPSEADIEAGATTASLQNGNTYTFSFEYKSTNQIQLLLQLRPGLNLNTTIFSYVYFDASSSWKRASVKIKMAGRLGDETIAVLTMRLNAAVSKAGDTCSFRKICLVEGESADWVPATSDNRKLVQNMTSIEEVRLYDNNTGSFTNITRSLKENGLALKLYDNFGVISYPGTLPIPELKHEGQYYLAIRCNADWFYSDIFCSTNRVDDYLLLEYSNSYNFEVKGGIIDFSDNFKFKCYLDTQVGKPEYEFEEAATERMGYTFIESQVSKKIYKFTFLAPEYLCDALRIVRLCNNKQITSKQQTYDLSTFSMDPKWQDQGDLAAVECSFETDTVIANIGGYAPKPLKGDFNNDFNNDFDIE